MECLLELMFYVYVIRWSAGGHLLAALSQLTQRNMGAVFVHAEMVTTILSILFL